ncbi:MAG: hypothetical protein H6842_11290 [Rhodospirillaceae bacterium]|nr:hypothetical protein [Rhodospirillaceae bacterium]
MPTRLLAFVVLVAGAAGSIAPASARLPMTGCWTNGTATFQMRICVADSGLHTIAFSWDEPPTADMPATSGSCGGDIDLTDLPGLSFAMTVPRQADACMRDGQVEPLWRREYHCLWQLPDAGPAAPFVCEEAVYITDDDVYSEIEGLRFERMD